MADYGVTTEGFVLKRFQNIKADIVAGLQAAFGQINTAADSVFGQLIGVFGNELADLWEQAENVYNAMYPATAEGQHLDNAADFTGAVRLAASSSTAVVQMTGDEDTVVPAGTVFSQSVAKEPFETLLETTISPDALHVCKVRVVSASAGTYSIDIDGVTVSYVATGSPSKSDISAGLTAAVTAEATLADVLAAAHTSGDDYLTLTAVDLSLTGTFEAAVSSGDLELYDLATPAAVSSQTQGKIAVPLGSINTVDTPVVGLDSVTNLAEGTEGRDAETDDAFRVRRRNSLGVVSSSTLAAIKARLLQDLPSIVTNAFIFENPTDDVDDHGRPAHCFEAVVAALETTENSTEIAELLWSLKPSGIQAYGSTVVDIADSNGNTQHVGFSYAATKYAWVEVTYDRSGADTVFPADGETQIKAAVLALGEGLSFGSDLLKQRFENCGYVAGGVTNVTVRLAVTDTEGGTPDWQTTNISIDTAEFPSFDNARITVQEA